MAGANVFVRLNYDFDSTKFGEAANLSNATVNFLEENPVSLTDWQKVEIANGTFVRTDYYQNPTINVTNQLWNNVNAFNIIINSIYDFDANANPNCALIAPITNELAANQIYYFQRHTNNISGVTVSVPTFNESTGTNEDYPDYDKATGLGQELLLVLNDTDELANAIPLLGNFRCLFVNDDIEDVTLLINTDTQTVNNSIRVETIPNPNTDPAAPPTITVNLSNLTFDQINTIFSHANTANNLIFKNREDDWFFYRSSVQILKDYRTIERLTRLGKTQRYLVENLIGTDEYIDKLSANN
jgi:hypothetical protein